MKRRYGFWLRAVLLGLPLGAAVLWLASGRQVLTKPTRVVDVQVKDPLFGDTIDEKRFVRGPVFGWYVGLDSVIGVSAGSLVVAGGAWVLGRRLGRPKETL